MTALQAGELTYVEGGREHHYAVGGGFLQVADNRVIVLADTAEAAERHRRGARQARLRRGPTKLLQMTEQDEHYRQEAARVRRAAARLAVAGER